MDCFHVNDKNVTYFESFGVERIPKIKKLIGNKNIITDIYRIQVYDTMCRWFCTGFIDFMLKRKSLLEHTSLFSPNDKWKTWQNN